MTALIERGIYVLRKKGNRSFQVFQGSSLSAVKDEAPSLFVKISTWTGRVELRDEPSQDVIATSKRKSWSSKYDVQIAQTQPDNHTVTLQRAGIFTTKRFFALPSGMKCVVKRGSSTGQYVVFDLQSNDILATFEKSVSFRKAGVLRLHAPGHSQQDLTSLFMAIATMLKIAQDRQRSAASASNGSV
ncbi:hypothetical protein E3P99_03048 [Wallemia hederae]|uniref:Tubby C-terminal domain-containing protein n=1 Tax=Wallemia hederae TaxID=1540922 RepID=A0A4T0FLM5_9BASI|nr:hypothetical protein E3P99_03048 [Wallemia hederae]